MPTMWSEPSNEKDAESVIDGQRNETVEACKVLVVGKLTFWFLSQSLIVHCLRNCKSIELNFGSLVEYGNSIMGDYDRNPNAKMKKTRKLHEFCDAFRHLGSRLHNSMRPVVSAPDQASEHDRDVQVHQKRADIYECVPCCQQHRGLPRWSLG